MPAIVTTAVFAGAGLFLWSLCRAIDRADAATEAEWHASRVRARERLACQRDHPSRRLRLVRGDLRPFDWQHDAPELGA